MSVDRLSKDWEELGAVDPLWAILSDPAQRNQRWDLQEFLATGQKEFDGLVSRMLSFGYPKRFGRALDFGCGVGRVTRAMADHFEACVGVDISSTMLAQAVDLNRATANCSFHLNQRPDLQMFEPASFDLVYSNIVLQHVPSSGLIEAYIGEFCRVLKPDGLLVFQLPSGIPLRYRLQPRRRLYSFLRGLRIPTRYLQTNFGLHPISMSSVPEQRVLAVLGKNNIRVLGVDRTQIVAFGIDSRTYWAIRG